MAITKLNQTTPRCPKCSSDKIIHPLNADFEDEATCGACGMRDVARVFSAFGAKREGNLRLSQELLAGALGDVRKKGV